MLKNKNVFHQQTNTKQRRSPLKDTPKKKREREKLIGGKTNRILSENQSQLANAMPPPYEVRCQDCASQPLTGAKIYLYPSKSAGKRSRPLSQRARNEFCWVAQDPANLSRRQKAWTCITSVESTQTITTWLHSLDGGGYKATYIRKTSRSKKMKGCIHKQHANIYIKKPYRGENVSKKNLKLSLR